MNTDNCSKCRQPAHPTIPCSEAKALRDPTPVTTLYIVWERQPGAKTRLAVATVDTDTAKRCVRLGRAAGFVMTRTKVDVWPR